MQATLKNIILKYENDAINMYYTITQGLLTHFVSYTIPKIENGLARKKQVKIHAHLLL